MNLQNERPAGYRDLRRTQISRPEGQSKDIVGSISWSPDVETQAADRLSIEFTGSSAQEMLGRDLTITR